MSSANLNSDTNWRKQSAKDNKTEDKQSTDSGSSSDKQCKYCKEDGHLIYTWNAKTRQKDLSCPKLIEKEQRQKEHDSTHRQQRNTARKEREESIRNGEWSSAFFNFEARPSRGGRQNSSRGGRKHALPRPRVEIFNSDTKIGGSFSLLSVDSDSDSEQVPQHQVAGPKRTTSRKPHATWSTNKLTFATTEEQRQREFDQGLSHQTKMVQAKTLAAAKLEARTATLRESAAKTELRLAAEVDTLKKKSRRNKNNMQKMDEMAKLIENLQNENTTFRRERAERIGGAIIEDGGHGVVAADGVPQLAPFPEISHTENWGDASDDEDDTWMNTP